MEAQALPPCHRTGRCCHLQVRTPGRHQITAAPTRCGKRRGRKSQEPADTPHSLSETSSYFLMLFRHSYCSESHTHQLAPLGRSTQKAYCVAVKSPRIHSSKCKPSFPPHSMRLPLPPYYYVSYPCKEIH